MNDEEADKPGFFSGFRLLFAFLSFALFYFLFTNPEHHTPPPVNRADQLTRPKPRMLDVTEFLTTTRHHADRTIAVTMTTTGTDNRGDNDDHPYHLSLSLSLRSRSRSRSLS
ncbi:hypothetical protein Q3G72_026891 [Acer saccharum]|nr:hypothetical protein Q3G72_026891 [Acer saccharum]